MQKLSNQYRETALGQIPESWEIISFEDLVYHAQLGTTIRSRNVKDGLLLIKMGNLTFGGFDFTKVEYVNKNQVENYQSLMLHEGDLLFNTRNSEDLVGKCAVWKKGLPEAIFDNNILRIRFKRDKVWSSDYISFILNSYNGRKKLETIIKRTTSVAAIYYKDLKSYKIPLPPLPEQTKIVNILLNTDELTLKTEQIIQQIRRLNTSLMQMLLTKGIGHAKFKKIQFGTRWMITTIPVDWSYKKLTDVAKFRQGLQIAKINRYKVGGINRIKLIKITDFYENRQSDEYIDLPNSSRDVICCKDDIIVARTGNTLGMVLTDVEGVFHNNTFALDYDKEIFSKMFFYYLLKSPQVQLFMKIVSTRTGQPDLTHNELSNLVLVIPPIKEQERIASILSTMDANLRKQIAIKSELENLKNWLIKMLLTGKLRVKA